MMWSAGVLAAISSISYPAISAFVSMHADADKQGLVQVSLPQFVHSFHLGLRKPDWNLLCFVVGDDHWCAWSL